MALHACSGFIVTQDVSIVELSPHFVISLSRYFIAQIGGYIALDQSCMFFRTRYGTKSSLKAKPLSLNHIETYTPNPIKMNCTIQEEDEECISHEDDTSLAEVPDYLLDEWVDAYKFDPIWEVMKTSLGTYCIFE